MSDRVPEGWHLQKLGDLTTLITKGTTPQAYANEGINFIKIESISSNKTLVPEKFAKIDANTHQNQKRSQLENGDILFAIAGSLGRLAIIKSHDLPANTNQAIAIIRLANSSVDKQFCLHQLGGNRIQSKIRNLQTVGAQPNLSLQQVSDFALYLPPLAEQKKIAAILTSVDDVIETTQKQIDKLQVLKKATMNELLTKGIGHTEFKDSELGRIPKGWEVKAIGDSCDIKNTLRHPISREEREKIRGNYPYYGPTGVLDHLNEYRLEGEYTLIGEDGDHFIKFYEKPQALYVKGKFNVNNHAHVLEGNTLVSTKWIFWFFLHRDIRPALTRQGAGRFKLNKESLLKLKIAIPSIGEQDEIDQKLESFNSLIKIKKRNLTQTQSLKKSLMHDLLTGKVRVQIN